MSISAGQLRHRLQFEVRTEQQDGFGNTVSEYVPQFEMSCGIIFLKGSETVIASRLEARSPIVITMRNSQNARRVTNDWRARNLRDGRIYQIKEMPRPSEDRSILEVLAEGGVAG